MANPSIVVVIDQSGSMGTWGYLAPAQTDASTFINIMNVGDRLGVVAFSDSSSVIVPASGTQIVTVQSLVQLFAAAQTVMQLRSLNMTNFVAALASSHTLIDPAPAPRGIVFLSDGLWNTGGDPMPGLATNVPIHTIALGANGQLTALQTMAQRTGGQYHFTPDAVGLGQIYNQIAGTTQVASLVANATPTVGQFRYTSTPGIIPASATQASFALSWDDRSVVYTPNTPQGQQVNVFLYDPTGQRVNTQASATGPGYVVFRIPSPIAGTYTAYAWYSGTGSLTYTAGIFDDASSVQLNLEMSPAGSSSGTSSSPAADSGSGAGGPADFTVRFTDDGEPVAGAHVEVSVESPLRTLADALEMYGPAIAGMAVGEDVPPERADEARLASYAAGAGLTGVVLPRVEQPVPVREIEPGVYAAQLPVGGLLAGSHTVRITATGDGPRTGGRVMRSARTSFHVPS